MPIAELSAKICPLCQEPHIGFFSVCYICTEAQEAQRQEQAKREAHIAKGVEWKEMCPPIYRTSDWGRTDIATECANVAQTWWAKDDGKGLGIYGGSGLGKTRAMWEILKRHHFAGRKVKAIDAIGLENAAGDRHYSDRRESLSARHSIQQCKHVGILYIDDLGKERASPAVAKVLHDIIEHRTRNRLTTLWTSEKVGAELGARLGDDYADGLIRRLREFSTIIQANPQSKNPIP